MDEKKPDTEIELTPVISSNVAAIGFDSTKGIMRVKFNTGGLYEAPGATQADYDMFLASKSKGIHFNKILKRAFAWTPVTKKS